MGLGRYLAAVALSAFLAVPAVAQTTSPSGSPGRPAAPAPSTTPPSTTTTQPRATSSEEQGGLIDINSASAQELDKLPGVGPARAQAIIANRPYKGKDDLAQRKILPKNVYDQIKDKIIARQASAKDSVSSTALPSGATKPK